ncbi:MAG TPA: NrfD/PsrC family molybdoenzyme membrane anchor subunit, partial [Streptosporangiaceae bacterium]|nr:NrfD/PsrC family molybdoenzyme membrane anchor subunit [Streptosporangiaceae bacterium]
GRPSSSAAALLSYDVPHQAPWGWRVSLYTWTKSIAAGSFGVAALLAITGVLSWGSPAIRWAAPLLALAFLGVTGVLLIWDLKHPLRFYLIFTRHHWSSWLVRGSFIIGGYGAVVALFVLAALLGSVPARQVLAWCGLPLALATAVYTAYLLAQAKARDLWQSPLLPAHLAISAVLAGAAATLPLLVWLSPGRAVTAAEVMLAAAASIHILQMLAETTLPHVTAHAHLAIREMVRGRFAWFFWPGLVLVAASVAAPWIGMVAAPLALAGLLAHEHAYVQAGQSVPLA